MRARPTDRLPAALAAIEDAGLSKSDIAKIAGVHRSQVSRWFSGEHRPGYDPAMRVAGYLRREHPRLADEFTAAAGYGGPAEPEPESPVPPELTALIRRLLPPDRQQEAIDALADILFAPTEPGEGRPSRRAS
jgi:transcriptional regulator with XRE-family HTH domain